MKIETIKVGQSIDLIPFNRSINPNVSLRNSLRKYGFIDPIKLIRTSIFGKKDNLYVIDGQHRYNEGKILRMSIPYIELGVFDDLPGLVNLMATLNNTQRKWNSDNYVDCYCAIGNSNYLYLRTIKGKTGFTYDALSYIYTGTSKTINIKNGTFTILDKNKGDLVLSYVQDILKTSKFPIRAVRGFVSFYNQIKDYNHQKFIRNLKSNIPLLSDCMETTQFANMFQIIYKK